MNLSKKIVMLSLTYREQERRNARQYLRLTKNAAGEAVLTVSAGNKNNMKSRLTIVCCFEYDVLVGVRGVVTSSAIDRSMKK